MASRCSLYRTLALAVGIGLLAWGVHSCQPQERPDTPAPQAVALTTSDRILVLAPHPDDEVLGCGGIIQQAVAMHLPVRVVFFTYGDNNQWSFLVYRRHPVLRPQDVRKMGLLRHDEAMAAGRILGLSPDQLTFLGYPDFGTLRIWKDHWGKSPLFRSMLTKVTAVPYPNALRPGAPYKGEEVVRDLTAILTAFRPTKVFVSHPADHMPDHAALYLFARIALWDVERQMRPAVYPYLVHFRHWPPRLHAQPDSLLEPPEFFRSDIAWQAYRLTPEQVERKLAAIKAHHTQYAYSPSYLLSFIRPNELFGDFPAVAVPASRPPTPLTPEASPKEPPEQLTDEERTAFIGVETRTISRDGDDLVLSMRFSRPLVEGVGASVYVFGYRADRPFAQMPKLQVKLSPITTRVFDQRRLLNDARVRIIRHARTLTIRIPLASLGDPDRILTSARTYLGEVPLDWTSWRVLELK